MPEKFTIRTSFPISFLCLLIVITSSACSSLPETSPAPLPPTQISTPTPTLQPSPTPSIPIGIFIPPSDDFLNLTEPMRSTFASLVSQQGWSFVETDSIKIKQLSDDIRVVVFFEPSPEIVELAASTPEIQFVAIGAESLEPKANLSVIGPEGFRLDQQAFLGGYLAAILTQDWRIGEIVEVPDVFNSTIEVSFRNGVKFYCGLCQLSYPPFNDYPIYTTVDSETHQVDWTNSIDFLESNAVETVFLFVQNFELGAINKLVDSGIFLIGNKSPPKTIRSNWIATIRLAPEQALSNQWEQIISTQGGWVENIPIILEDVNQILFSEGKQRFIDRILLDLQSGYIDPAATPPAPVAN